MKIHAIVSLFKLAVLSLFYQVVELAEIDNFLPELALTFFKKVLYPKAAKDYQDESNVSCHTSGESGEPLLVELTMKCITVHKIPRAQVRFL